MMYATLFLYIARDMLTYYLFIMVFSFLISSQLLFHSRKSCRRNKWLRGHWIRLYPCSSQSQYLQAFHSLKVKDVISDAVDRTIQDENSVPLNVALGPLYIHIKKKSSASSDLRRIWLIS